MSPVYSLQPLQCIRTSRMYERWQGLARNGNWSCFRRPSAHRQRERLTRGRPDHPHLLRYRCSSVDDSLRHLSSLFPTLCPNRSLSLSISQCPPPPIIIFSSVFQSRSLCVSSQCLLPLSFPPIILSIPAKVRVMRAAYAYPTDSDITCTQVDAFISRLTGCASAQMALLSLPLNSYTTLLVVFPRRRTLLVAGIALLSESIRFTGRCPHWKSTCGGST